MLKFYRDFNSRIAGVYQRDAKVVLGMRMAGDGLKPIRMSPGEFAKKYTHPLTVDSRKAALSWYCRALTKTGNDPRSFQILGECIMEKPLNEMTMEEIIAHHNALATGLDLPTVESFKSLKAARAAVEKLGKPAKAAKAPKEPADPEKLGRGPVQGVGAFAKACILEGGTNKEVLDKVLEQFPTAKTSTSCIAYYRNKLVASGQLAARVLKKSEAPAEAVEAEAPAEA